MFRTEAQFFAKGCGDTFVRHGNRIARRNPVDILRTEHMTVIIRRGTQSTVSLVSDESQRERTIKGA